MPFTEADADVFFGRETEVRLIVDTAKARRFGVLYGPSGVGKSSVLQAGVVRQIRDENARRFERFGAVETVVAYLKEWRDDPYAALTAAVRDALAAMPGATTLPERPAEDDVAAETLALRAERGVDLLLILDQFEEFFLYHRDESERFAELLDELTERGTRINVLVALREDALALLDEFEADIPGVFDNTLRLEHLDARAAEAAIRSPLEHHNAGLPEAERITIEDELVQALLAQLRTGSVQVDSTQDKVEQGTDQHGSTRRIEAPYLQLVLIRLWDEEARRGSKVLRLSTLRDLGGAQDIVRQHLDRVMRGFSPPEMAVLADAFGHLVTPSGSKIAHRPSDLAEFSGRDPAQVEALLRRLAEGDQRILRDVPPPLDEPHAEPRYEIFHDVLALAVLDWRRRFLAEAESRRQQAELVAEKERVEQETRATRSRLRKARTLIAAMALLLVACVALAGWAFYSRSSAEDAKDRAQSSEQDALESKFDAELSEARSQLDTDPSGALRNLVDVAEESGGSPPESLEGLLRQAMDAADTDVELALGSSVVFSGFAGADLLVAVTESGQVRAWDVTGHDPVRLDEDPRLDVSVTDTPAARVVQAFPAADNAYVVVLTDDGVVSSVDLESGEVRKLDQTFGDGAYLEVPESGTRKRVLISDYERNLVVWDVAADEVVPTPPPGDRLDDAALDPSGRTVAMVSGLQVDVYDLDTLRRTARRTFDTHIDPPQIPQTAVVGFTDQPGVMLVVVNGSKAEISRWELDGDKVEPLGGNLWWKQLADAAEVSLSQFHYLAVAGDKTVMLFDDDGVFQAQTDFANDFVTSVTTNPADPSVWALGTAEGYSSLYRLNRYPPKPVWTFRGQAGPITTLEFSPDGANVVTGSANGTVRVWRVPDSTMEWYIPDRILNATYTPDGAYLFGFTPGGSVVRETRAPELATRYPSLFGQAVDMAPSPDGTRAVVTDSYCTMPTQVSFAKKDPAVTLQPPAKDACPTVIAWNPDPARHQIVAGTFENRLVAWDADSGAPIGDLALGPDSSEVHSIAMSADGGTLVAGTGTGASGEVHVVRTDDLTTVAMSWPTSAVDWLAVSADGRYVVGAGNDDHHVVVWDAEDGEELQSFDDATGTLNHVSIASDEDASRVSVAASSGEVYVWDRESGKLLAVTRRHADSANQATFDPEDTDRLVSAGDDGVMYSFTCEVCSLGADELDEAAEDRLAQLIDLTG